MAHSEEDLPMVDGYVFVTSMKKTSLDGAKSNNWFLLFNFHDISLIRSTVEWALTSEGRKWIIFGLEWDVKAGVPIIVIGGNENANEFAYLRASELIEGSWSSVLLRDECDVDKLLMLKWSFSMRILVLLSSDSVSGFGIRSNCSKTPKKKMTTLMLVSVGVADGSSFGLRNIFWNNSTRCIDWCHPNISTGNTK